MRLLSLESTPCPPAPFNLEPISHKTKENNFAFVAIIMAANNQCFVRDGREHEVTCSLDVLRRLQLSTIFLWKVHQAHSSIEFVHCFVKVKVES